MSDRSHLSDRVDHQLTSLQAEQAKQVAGKNLSAVERAETLYELRRVRGMFFGANADLFSEPAWDMLLDIFVARERGVDLSVSDTCLGSGVPTTTALRWIALMESRGLITKVRDSQDGRRHFVRLTPQAYEALRLYLEAC